MTQQISFVYGGRSVEHDCSIGMYNHFVAQAEEILAHYYAAKVIYIDITGEVTVYTCSPNELPTHEEIVAFGVRVAADDLPKMLRIDNVFLFSLLQGQDGEDGRFQAISEFFNLKSSCGQIVTNAVGNDKDLQHQIAVATSPELVPIKSMLLPTQDCVPSDKDLAPFIGKECVLKPNTGGGSFLTELVGNLTRQNVIDFAARSGPFCNHFLLQERVEGQDVTCGVLLRDGQPQLLPVAALETASKFFGYEEKWIKDEGYNVNFDAVPPEVSARVQRITRQLMHRFDYHTYCRFDFMMGNNHEVFFLEVNTGPGLTEASIYPKMLRQAGMSLVDLLTAAIKNEEKNLERRKQYLESVQSVRVSNHKGGDELAA